MLRPARSYSGGILAVLVILMTTLAVAPLRAVDPVDSVITAYYPVIVEELPEKVQSTLAKISSLPRRYLALSYYIRRSDEIADGWSWTTHEVRAYRATTEFDEMVEDVERVRSQFAETNPGFSLGVNISARSLGTQISKWNSVSSVSRAAHDFLDSAERFTQFLLGTDTNGVLNIPERERIDSFRQFLGTYGPSAGRVPTVAVPGLSKHGQLRAFDFKVYKGRRMIAGASSRTIPSNWDRPGWTDRLRLAAAAASPRFIGPLPVPYEPWHYDYDPSKPRFPHVDTARIDTTRIDTVGRSDPD